MRRFLAQILAISAIGLAQGCAGSPAQPSLSVSAGPSGRSETAMCGEYRALPVNGQPPGGERLATIRTILENRLMDYGLVEPDVQTQGDDGIVVQLPRNAYDQDEVRALIRSIGRLDFVAVPPGRTGEVVVGQPIPVGFEVIFNGDQIDTVSAGFTTAGQRAVDLTFRDEGARIFDDYAEAHFGEQFAIVLDGAVVAAPTIQATRFGGKAQISGAFDTQAEVARFVTVLKYGALPNAIEEVSLQPCPTE